MRFRHWAKYLHVTPHIKEAESGIHSRSFACGEMAKSKVNPRYSNGNLRRKYRARLKARGDECGICHGALGPIHYDEPSDSAHPLSFVVDEIHPVSRWREFGYDSPQAAAQDWNNLQAAHYICNAKKSNKINYSFGESERFKINIIDGDW